MTSQAPQTSCIMDLQHSTPTLCRAEEDLSGLSFRSCGCEILDLSRHRKHSDWSLSPWEYQCSSPSTKSPCWQSRGQHLVPIDKIPPPSDQSVHSVTPGRIQSPAPLMQADFAPMDEISPPLKQSAHSVTPSWIQSPAPLAQADFVPMDEVPPPLNQSTHSVTPGKSPAPLAQADFVPVDEISPSNQSASVLSVGFIPIAMPCFPWFSASGYLPIPTLQSTYGSRPSSVSLPSPHVSSNGHRSDFHSLPMCSLQTYMWHCNCTPCWWDHNAYRLQLYWDCPPIYCYSCVLPSHACQTLAASCSIWICHRPSTSWAPSRDQHR